MGEDSVKHGAQHPLPARQTGELARSVILAAGGLGMAPLARKAALESGANPMPLAIATVSIAAAIAALVLLAREGREIFSASSRTWGNVFLVGALGSGAVSLLAILAMTETSATNRGLFQAMYPVATAVAARLLLGERLDAVGYGLIAAMTLGLLAMNSGAQGLVLGGPFLMLAATLPLIGLSDVYARRTLRSARPGFVTVGRLLSGAAVLLLALPFTDEPQWQAVLHAWPWVVTAGCAAAAGLLGLYRAMNLSGASLAAAFAATAPVITLAGEWLILDAGFTRVQVSGVALVVAGAVLLARRSSTAGGPK